jgi:hypothetical protein
MHFTYEGFKHEGNRRCFMFRSVEERTTADVFSIEVELPLFFKNRVPVQDGPSFCLELLTKASSDGPIELERLHSYQVVGDDFRSLVVERERREAEKAIKRRSRGPHRKPGFNSNLRLGQPSNAS